MGEALITFVTANIKFIEGLALFITASLTVYSICKKILEKVIQGQVKEPFCGLNGQITSLAESVDSLTKTVGSLEEASHNQLEKINMILEHQGKLDTTDRHILRALITGKYYEYVDLGYMPRFEKECISLLFDDYKERGGNSFIDGLYNQLMELPVEPPAAS